MSQAQYIETVESTLIEMFPEIVSTGQVTKKQLIAVKAKLNCPFPHFLMQNRVGRGIYAFNAVKAVDFQQQSTKAVLPVKSNPNNVVGDRKSTRLNSSHT